MLYYERGGGGLVGWFGRLKERGKKIKKRKKRKTQGLQIPSTGKRERVVV